ncbi:MAG: DNA recombination protein RmuC [Nitrospirota bacterium]
METITFLIIGGLIGGIVIWIIASSRLKESHSRQIANLHMNYSGQITELEGMAKSTEAVNSELRQQLQQKDSEISQIRNELNSERQSKVEALTRLESAQKNFEEQKALIEAMKTEMTDTFNALSKAALESSNESFLTLASERLGKVVEETKGKLGEHQATMDGLIKPLQEALERYEKEIHAIEIKRKQDYTSLDEQIKMLSSTASNLATALRKPHIRGRWGEIALRNVVELAGMSNHVDFEEQVVIKDEDTTKKPDMVIKLPGGGVIVVDSKVSIDALLDVTSAQSGEAKKEALKKHAQHVKDQIIRLGSKAYWEQFEKAPEVVVLFMEESFLVSAFEVDPTLLEFGLSKKVLVATPTTFFALLKAVAHIWKEEQITKNAQLISELGRQLYERMNTLVEHLESIGSALEKAIGAYNKAVGSLELRVLPSVRKFKELGVTSADEIPIIEQIDQTPRNLNLLESDSNESDK